MRDRPLLNYYGGKFTSRNWIISHIKKNKTYVEPFGGGANILLFKERSKNEIYNDLDDEIVNVFKIMRDKSDALKHYLKYTPYSRSIYINSRNNTKCDVERAAFTIIKSFMGIGDSINRATGFRNSISQNSSPSTAFKNYIDHIDVFVDRLKGVVIEQLDWMDCITRYDRHDTSFYVDPPYLHSTRLTNNSYKHEIAESDHLVLISILKNIKGHCVLSGYDNDIYDELGWSKSYKKVDTQSSKRTEVIWCN